MGAAPLLFNRLNGVLPLPSGTPGDWVTLNTLNQVPVEGSYQGVKLDASFQLMFSNPASVDSVINVTYRILRNSQPVYSNRLTYDHTRTNSAVNFAGPVSLTYVDTPETAGSYSYVLQARVDSATSRLNPQVSEANFNASTFDIAVAPPVPVIPNYLFVIQGNVADDTAYLTYIDPVTNEQVGDSIAVGTGITNYRSLFYMALSPLRDRIYIVNLNEDTLYVVDTLSKTVIGTILLGTGWYRAPIVVTPDNRFVYVSLYSSDTNSTRVTCISTVSLQVNHHVDINGSVQSMAVSPDSSTLFVSIMNSSSIPGNATYSVDAITIGVNSVIRNIFADAINQYGPTTYVNWFNSLAVVGTPGNYEIQSMNRSTTSKPQGDIYWSPVNNVFDNNRSYVPNDFNYTFSPLQMVGLSNDTRYVIQEANVVSRMTGNTFVEKIPSYPGQFEIMAVPDEDNVVVLIRSGPNAGLHIIPVVSGDGPTLNTQLVPFSTPAIGLAVTADSRYAFSLENANLPNTIYRVDLTSRTLLEPVTFGWNVAIFAGSYVNYSLPDWVIF